MRNRSVLKFDLRHHKTRHGGLQLRQNIMMQLQSNKEIILDFTKVETISSSFADEALGQLAFQQEQVKMWQDKKIIVKSSRAIYDVFLDSLKDVEERINYREDRNSFFDTITILRCALKNQA